MALSPNDRYLVHALLPRNQISILAGASGVGKSTLILQLLGMIQRGEPLPGGHDYQPGMRVAFIKADRNTDELVDAALDCRCDITQMHVEGLVGQGFGQRIRLNSKGLLMELLARCLPCDVVVIDPLVALFGDDPRMYNKMFGHLVELADWCAENSVTIWGTHHTVKARTDFGFKRPQDQISGSSALLGFSSTQMILCPPEGQIVTYQFHIVPHRLPPETLNFTRDDHGLFVPWTGDLDNLDTKKVLEMFPDPDKTITKAYVATAFPDMPPQDLDAHLKVLIEQGWLTKAAHGRLRRSGN